MCVCVYVCACACSVKQKHILQAKLPAPVAVDFTVEVGLPHASIWCKLSCGGEGNECHTGGRREVERGRESERVSE